MQNRQTLEFFDPIVGKDPAVYHTAGVLQGGRKIWILAKLPSDIREDIEEDIEGQVYTLIPLQNPCFCSHGFEHEE